MEQFSIPGAGGIIVREINGEKNILIQTRVKPNAPRENGLLEIPAGKIRACENIYDTLRREVKEETGLDVVEIVGESESTIYEENGYKVINYMPFACAQNLIGEYPIMVSVFICKVEGELLVASDEACDYRWITISQLKQLVDHTSETMYPMNVDTLRKFVRFCETRGKNEASSC